MISYRDTWPSFNKTNSSPVSLFQRRTRSHLSKTRYHMAITTLYRYIVILDSSETEFEVTNYYESLRWPHRPTFRQQLDFLKKCLDKDPNERWTCEQLLRHSYFDNFHYKMPDVEMEEFEKLKKYRERSRVSVERSVDVRVCVRARVVCV